MRRRLCYCLPSPAGLFTCALLLLFSFEQFAWAASATQPAVNPQDIFNSRGLTRMGFLLIVPAETEVHDGVGKVKTAKARDAFARQDTGVAVKRASAALDSMQAQEKSLIANYQEVNEEGKNISRSNSVDYNDYVARHNSLAFQIESLRNDIIKQDQTLEELKTKAASVGADRMAYVNLALETDAKAEAVATEYGKLARDSELAAAIEQFNKTAKPHVKLGPSGIFTADLPTIRAIMKEVSNGAVPLDKTAGDNQVRVQAVLNGHLTESMVWDSGASAVVLGAKTAASLELKLDKGRRGEATVADGRKIKTTEVMLDSIQLGAFTVKNVPCIVLPPGEQSPDLLGNTFQSHFVARLDQSAGELQLAPDATVLIGAAPK